MEKPADLRGWVRGRVELQPWFSDVVGLAGFFRVFAFLSGQPEPWGMEIETLGGRIKRLREARHLTQPELAKLLNVSPKSVSNWEADRNHPRSRMGALVEIFGPAVTDEAGEAIGDGDQVVAAINASSLTRGRKAKLVGLYYDMLDDQERDEVRGA